MSASGKRRLARERPLVGQGIATNEKLDYGIEVQRQVGEVSPAQWPTILRDGAHRKMLTPKEVGIFQVGARMPGDILTDRQSAVLVEILD